MNTHPGTLGYKLGMTQVFDENGKLHRVTVIEAPAYVVGKRTVAKDGYSALIVGLGERKEKRTNKPLKGFFEKNGVSPKRFVRELRLDEKTVAEYEIGQKIALDKIFQEGQYVDVQAKSKGRGFAGVMKRHNFHGQTKTHGTHEYKRHGGSIGTNMTPGRVLPGLKMAGQYGNKKVSVLNLRVVKVIPEKDLILVRGGVPGARNQMVIIRGAVKKMGGVKKG